jgi:hypothetical protein
VHYLSSPCTLSSLVVHSLSRLCTSIHPLHLLSAFIPCVHHVHLNPSIAPLYLLRYSTADPLNSLSTFRANPPIVHVGHYSQPTSILVDRELVSPLHSIMHAAGELVSPSTYSQCGLTSANGVGMSVQGWCGCWHTNTLANGSAGWSADT